MLKKKMLAAPEYHTEESKENRDSHFKRVICGLENQNNELKAVLSRSGEL